jgi:uncharacterized protein
MIIDEIHSKKDEILLLLKKYGGIDIKVFGSVARQEETETSDIDFLVDFPRGYGMFEQRLPLQEDLEEMLHRKVDLIVKHELNKYIKDSVIKESVSI